MFSVFFFLTGALLSQLLRRCGVHMDLVSFCFLLFNFSVSLKRSVCCGVLWRDVMSCRVCCAVRC